MVVSARGFDPAVRVNLEAPARVLIVPKKGYAAVVEREWRTGGRLPVLPDRRQRDSVGKVYEDERTCAFARRVSSDAEASAALLAADANIARQEGGPTSGRCSTPAPRSAGPSSTSTRTSRRVGPRRDCHVPHTQDAQGGARWSVPAQRVHLQNVQPRGARRSSSRSSTTEPVAESRVSLRQT